MIFICISSAIFVSYLACLVFFAPKALTESELKAKGFTKVRDIHGDERNQTNASSVWVKGNKIKYGNP